MFYSNFFKVFLFSVILVPFLSTAEEVGEEFDLDSVAVSVKTCAEKAAKAGKFDYVLNCPPSEPKKSGYVIFAPTEIEYYYIETGKLYNYQLDELFSTSGRQGILDANAKVVGERDGILVIKIIEIYYISPRWEAIFRSCNII